MYTQEITHLDGSPWLKNFCDFTTCWPWITSTMIELFGCDYADITIDETEEHGDVLVVKGRAIGLLPVPKGVQS